MEFLKNQQDLIHGLAALSSLLLIGLVVAVVRSAYWKGKYKALGELEEVVTEMNNANLTLGQRNEDLKARVSVLEQSLEEQTEKLIEYQSQPALADEADKDARIQALQGDLQELSNKVVRITAENTQLKTRLGQATAEGLTEANQPKSKPRNRKPKNKQ